LVATLNIIFVKTRKETGNKRIHSEQCVAQGMRWGRFDVILEKWNCTETLISL